MGSSASRSTVTPYRNVQYSVLSSGVSPASLKARLSDLEDILDKLESDNQTQAQNAITMLRVLLNSSKEIPEDLLSEIEPLIYNFSYFVENQGEERAQQNQTKSSTKHSLGKTLFAAMVGATMGIIYSSFGDQEFNENESTGVTIITGTVATTIMAVNEIYTQFNIYRSASKQLALAEKKAIHDFESGILNIKSKLKQLAQDQNEIQLKEVAKELSPHLKIITNMLQLLAKQGVNKEIHGLINQLEKVQGNLNNETDTLVSTFNEADELIRSAIPAYVYGQNIQISSYTAQGVTSSILHESLNTVLALVDNAQPLLARINGEKSANKQSSASIRCT